MLSFNRLFSAGPRAFSSLVRLTALLLLAVAPAAFAGSTTVVISQVYSAGGNSGATYNADYIELHNVSSSPQSIAGFALQYSAATSATAAAVIPIPGSITIPAGGYYLIQGTASTTSGAPLPSTADVTLSGLAMGAGGGRIYLTSSTTAIAAGTNCSPTAVDWVGFGTSTCGEGGTVAPSPTTTLASIRAGNGCTDTDNNLADFATGTPAPHNSSSAVSTCSGGGTPPTPGNPTITGAADPTSIYQGTVTLLTATVTPGTNPASTGITVTADLSSYGGSSTQALLDDGNNGDAKAGDGIYSFNFTMPSNATLGAGTIPVTVTDTQTRKATSNISITVLAPVALVRIHDIYGSIQSTSSTPAKLGQTVMTTGIVTSVRANGFFLQARDADADADTTTPEGIFVHAGTGNVPPSATVGTYMQVSGTVSLYPTASAIPGTELDTPGGYTVLASGQPLPAATVLTTTNPSPSGTFSQLMRLQGMRISVPSLTVTGPTEGVLTETAETYASDGIFWGTVTGVTRPVREPGLEILDPFTKGQPSTIPIFDDNPELLRIDSLSATPSPGAIDVASGAILTGVTGVLDLSNPPTDGSTYVPTLLIDATTRPTVIPGTAAQPVKVAATNQITIGDQNFERLYNDIKDTTGATVVTTAAYQLRLAKASLAIRNMLRSPDILCMEEIENISVLNDLVAKISSDAQAAGQTDPAYTPYLVQGNDTSGINVAFLIKQSKITVTDVSQFGKTTTFTQPSTGNQATLNDRPPLVLTAGIKRTGTTDYPITVIVNHLKSLNNVTDTTGTGMNTRAKREIQAEFLANLVQGYQSAGKHVIVVGDMNAFEFNDGLVDTMDIVRGIVTPANQDVVPGPTTSLVTPNLVDLAPTNVAAGVYNYSYVGNAQSIEHFFVTSDIASQMTLSTAHYNSDFPVVYRNDSTRPEVGSDHDGTVGYLAVPGFTVITITPSPLTFAAQTLNTTTSQNLSIINSGSTAITVTSAVVTGSTAFTVPANPCGGSIAAGGTCTLAVSFKPTTSGILNGTLTLTDSDVTGTQTVALSGTGAGVFSTTSLLVSPTTFTSGATATMQATIGSSGAVGTLSGTVTFLDGTTTLKSGVALVSGVATFTTNTLAVGSHSITAVYSGDSIFPTSTSTAVTVTVNAPPVPDFTLTLANTQIIIPRNVPSSNTTVSVGMQNGFSQTVNFTCSGVPAGSKCFFTPASLSATGSTVLTIQINTATSSNRSPLGGGGALVAGLMLLPLLARRRTRLAVRRAAGAMMLLFLLVGVGSLTGCGSGNSGSTPVGTSTVTVTATGGSVTHSATVTVVVQ